MQRGTGKLFSVKSCIGVQSAEGLARLFMDTHFCQHRPVRLIHPDHVITHVHMTQSVYLLWLHS